MRLLPVIFFRLDEKINSELIYLVVVPFRSLFSVVEQVKHEFVALVYAERIWLDAKRKNKLKRFLLVRSKVGSKKRKKSRQ